jgi:hypothetical protein
MNPYDAKEEEKETEKMNIFKQFPVPSSCGDRFLRIRECGAHSSLGIKL